jgi:protein-S-isoprenylcysteine O-methyltransferase Ste14
VEKAQEGAEIHFPPPLIYVGGLVLGIVGARLLHLPNLGLETNVREVLGAALGLLGLAVSFAGAGLFLRRGTAIIPYKPASELVTSGIYRWTRNPMYLGLALIYAGIAVFLNGLVALLLLPLVLAIIQTQVIVKEEAYLKRTFGSDYVSYKNQVRPWI